ncbi:MAG: regulatory protein RecX [Veillonellales bacterium]
MNNFETAWSLSLRILARRSYSEQEMRTKLTAKGYSADVTDSVIKGLLEHGYLNDSVLCRMIFEQYCRSGKYGLRNIVGKLKQRGLSTQVISDITGAYDSATEWQRALILVKKRFKVPEAVDKRKIGQLLMQRGFSFDTINKVFEEFF